MPRFVVLEHESPRGRHWDFMLERSDSLATWALAQPPDSPAPIAADALADHRLAYLDYEGPISGGRGMVARWDHGSYQIETENAEGLMVTLAGDKLIGRATLSLVPEQPRKWLFTFASPCRRV